MRLTTEITAGAGPKSNPKPPAPKAMFFTTSPTGRFGQLKIMTSLAEHLPELPPLSSKNLFCAETLSCPTIAVGNNHFVTKIRI